MLGDSDKMRGERNHFTLFLQVYKIDGSHEQGRKASRHAFDSSKKKSKAT
jgi:hypothetical protein